MSAEYNTCGKYLFYKTKCNQHGTLTNLSRISSLFIGMSPGIESKLTIFVETRMFS